MPSESDLRDLLRDPEPEGRAAIDLDAVLTRARRRRRPKVLAAQALGSVAVVGALFTAVVVSLPHAAETTAITAQDTAAGSEAESAPFADDSTAKLLDACGEPASRWPILGWGLEVTDGGAVSAEAPVLTITLRNDGPLVATGEIEVTRVSFILDDVVIGHGNAAVPGGLPAELDAGEELTWDVPVTVEPCDPLLPLGPGTYEVRAEIEFRYASGDGPVIAEPIVGSPGRVELR